MGSNGETAAARGGASLENKSKENSASKNSASQNALSRDVKRERLKLYGWTAALAAVMVLVMFISRGIYPFGESVLRYSPDGQQYFGTLAQLQRALLTDDNVLFSWSMVLGGNMIGTYAYYAASPFNLLTVLFPGNLMAAYHAIFAVKFVSAAVCFAIMLRNMFTETDGKAVALFSVSYPFIGFMTFYAWNQSWMDAIVLLPLVLLGISHIVRDRKPLLYTVALALTLLSNYYTGYMVCLASVLLFVTFLILSRPNSTAGALKTCAWYAAATVVAAALAAVLLLPAYYSLPEGRAKSFSQLMDEIGYRSMPEETLSMLYTAPYNDMQWRDNYPVIFVGIVQLALVVMFFLNDEISRRYKAAAAVLLTVFALSFGISLLDTIWHAFTQNMWYNHRYSFLVSFILEIIAFYSFVHVSRAKTKLLLGAGLLAGITLFAQSAGKENVGPGTLLLDVTMICAVLALLYGYSKAQISGDKRQQRILFAAIAAVVGCNLLVNSYLSLDRIGERDTISAYRDAVNVDQKIAGAIDDDGFYRVGSTWRYGQCDPLRSGYAGVENYVSPENTEAIDAVFRLGVRAVESERAQTNIDPLQAHYGDNVPLSTDALLGLKYIVTGNEHKAGQYAEIGQIPEAYLHIYQNPHALPVLFPGAALYNTPDDTELNKFEHMNAYWNSISSEGGDIFEPIDVSREDTGTPDGYDIRLSFNALRDGPVYAYIPKGQVKVDCPLESYTDHLDVYYVGEYAAGEQGELIAHAKQGYDPGSSIVFYSENMDALAVKSDDVLSRDVQLDRKSGSELSMQYTADEDGFVTSTIPFDEGWRVYVDGTEVETYRNMDTFLTFDVVNGEHEIELIYWPPYFWAGVWVSVAALLAVAAYVYLERRKKTVTAEGQSVHTPRKPRLADGHEDRSEKKRSKRL